jgi:MFS transporter, PHS family, inorganic phosphate transporter
LIVYGISYFFTEFGPNATTFVYPAELFPVEGRTTGHGIASAAGKLGGFIGVFLFPILLTAGGLFAAESMAAAVSVLGILVTVFMLPETKNKSLEELSIEETENNRPCGCENGLRSAPKILLPPGKLGATGGA